MPYLNVLQIPRATAGLIAAGLSVISILGRLGFGWLADFFDKPVHPCHLHGMMSLGMFLLFHVDIWWIMILFLLPVSDRLRGGDVRPGGAPRGVLRQGGLRPSHRAGHGYRGNRCDDRSDADRFYLRHHGKLLCRLDRSRGHFLLFGRSHAEHRAEGQNVPRRRSAPDNPGMTHPLSNMCINGPC